MFSFCSIMLFALIHLFAEKVRRYSKKYQGKMLSFGSGVAISYVFVDLMPKLALQDSAVKAILKQFFPYLEHHVYLLALIGFLVFYLVDQSHSSRSSFWLSRTSYMLFNFFVGYAVADPNNLEVQPLLLFSIAIGLHYFVIDYSLSQAHGQRYDKREKWLLITALFLGWMTGFSIELSKTAMALIDAFIAGGVIMNVTRHELPRTNPHSVPTFLFSAFFYTAVLLVR
jgi:hypothetical protein